jgi:hypothetical protein
VFNDSADFPFLSDETTLPVEDAPIEPTVTMIANDSWLP